MSPVVRALSIVVAVKVAAIVVVIGIGFAFPDFDMPDQSTILTIAAVGVAMMDYSKRVRTKPSQGFLARFALGVVLAEFALLVPFAVALWLESGQAFSVQGFIEAVGGQELANEVPTGILMFFVGLGAIVTFVAAYGMAFITTRKLPEQDASSVFE